MSDTTNNDLKYVVPSEDVADFDLLSDKLFKLIFDETVRKPLIMSFINATLGYTPDDPRYVVEIYPANTELLPKTEGAKTHIVDLSCRTQAQEMVNIELQARKQEFYDKRILSYWARIFDSQVQQGQDFSKYLRTISINILNFNLDDRQCRKNHYYSRYNLREAEDHDAILTDDLEVHIFQVKRFLKQYKNVSYRQMNRVERFIYLFCRRFSMTELDQMGKEDPNTKIIADAFRTLRSNPDAYISYIKADEDLMSYNTNIRVARETGRAEGRAEG